MNQSCLFQLNFNSNKNVIFSLPQSSHYHQISNLKIDSLNYKIIQEKKWGNKIILLNKKSKLNFAVKTFSFKSTIKPSFTLMSYQKNKIQKTYLNSNKFINSKDPKIKSLAKKVLGQETNLLKVVKNLYDFTLNYLTYGKSIDGLYRYSQALNKKITDCGGFSTFLASLLQSKNIPSRLVVGFLIKKTSPIKQIFYVFWFKKKNSNFFVFDDLFMHAWLEILLPDSQWFPLDPSIEWRRKKGLTKREGGFGFIPSDRLVVSYGCDFKLKIKKKYYQIDLLQKPIFRIINF